MKKIVSAAIIIFTALLNINDVFSHPHARLTASLEFDFEAEKCRGFWVEWSFDDIFGTSVIREFDSDRNGSFDEKEAKRLYNEAFINLKFYGYFVFLRKGKTRDHPDTVENFSASQKKGRLFYRFYVPMKGESSGDDFSIAIFDRSFYCDIRYAAVPVVIKRRSKDNPTFDIAFEITKNKNYPVYYNPLGAADDMRIYQQWKPGLETAYPDEIRVFFKR